MKFKPAVLPFVVGVLVGALLFAAAQRPLMHRFGWRPPRPSPEKIARKMEKDLKLSPEQKAKVQAALDASFKRMKAFRDETRPRLKEIREATRQEIRALLDPGQQVRFDEISAEQDRRFEKFENKPGAP